MGQERFFDKLTHFYSLILNLEYNSIKLYRGLLGRLS